MVVKHQGEELKWGRTCRQVSGSVYHFRWCFSLFPVVITECLGLGTS